MCGINSVFVVGLSDKDLIEFEGGIDVFVVCWL